MKFNKKRKINKCEKYIRFIYENWEYCRVPLSYINKITRTKGKIAEIKIKKSFLETIDKYMCGHSDDMQKRFLSACDVTQIHTGNNHYYPNYIEQSWSLLGAYNVLQQIDIKKDMIIFHWDIDEVNKIVYKNNGWERYLQLSKKYENIVFDGYDEVKFV